MRWASSISSSGSRSSTFPISWRYLSSDWLSLLVYCLFTLAIQFPWLRRVCCYNSVIFQKISCQIDAVDDAHDARIHRGHFDRKGHCRFAGRDIDNGLAGPRPDGVDGDDRVGGFVSLAVQGFYELQLKIGKVCVLSRRPDGSDDFREKHPNRPHPAYRRQP